MAGNFRSGRKPAVKPSLSSSPVMPCELEEEAKRFWLANIATAKHLTAEDSDLARACCELWSLYRKSFAIANHDPCNRDARSAVSVYYQRFAKSAERLAIDPLGRLRAGQACEREDTDDPLKEFGIVAAG